MYKCIYKRVVLDDLIVHDITRGPHLRRQTCLGATVKLASAIPQRVCLTADRSLHRDRAHAHAHTHTYTHTRTCSHRACTEFGILQIVHGITRIAHRRRRASSLKPPPLNLQALPSTRWYGCAGRAETRPRNCTRVQTYAWRLRRPWSDPILRGSTRRKNRRRKTPLGPPPPTLHAPRRSLV